MHILEREPFGTPPLIRSCTSQLPYSGSAFWRCVIELVIRTASVLLDCLPVVKCDCGVVKVGGGEAKPHALKVLSRVARICRVPVSIAEVL
jgi:hypothetical protein